MRTFLNLAAGAMLAVGAGGAAHAATIIDFTDPTQFSNGDLSQSYNIGGTNIDVTLSSPQGVSFGSVGAVGGDCPSILACGQDGVGAGGDDEISGPGIFSFILGEGESVSVTFSQAVNVTALYFLDLFQGSGFLGGAETAEVELLLNGSSVYSTSVDADPLQGSGTVGFQSEAVGSITADVIRFTAAAGLGDGGAFIFSNSDYAVAGIEVAPVPLPAALPLFAAAVGTLAVVSRRRRRSAA